MRLPLERLRAKLADLERKARERGRATTPKMAKYLADPVGYAREVLRVEPTPDQAVIAAAFLEAPNRVKVRAGHNVGKTFLFAWLTNWWFDTRDPGVVITTAPTERDVVDLLWTEVRLQRHRAGLRSDFIGPAAPEMRTGPDHWAKGYTARKGESFQGRHRANMLFLFDEDEGIDPVYFQRTRTMFKPGDGHAWGSIGNPYTVTSQSYREEQATDLDGNPAWRLFQLSCLGHPNIPAGLDGQPLPVPHAVSVEQIDALVAETCEPVPAADRRPTDVEWRPGLGRWYRPGPLFEAGVLGRRPSLAAGAVWSESAFDAACTATLTWSQDDVPELGVDVAREGDDWSCVHGRRGPASLLHETGNGWDTMRTVGRVVDAVNRLAADWNRDNRGHRPLSGKDIPIKVDDVGVGGGVTDRLRELGYTVVAVNAQTVARRPDRYPARRDELWFDVAVRAAAGMLSLAGLDKSTKARLRQQAMTPISWLDSMGRRVVESKADTKRRLKGRSPDDMDAINLAYCEAGSDGPTVIGGRER